MRRHVGWVVAYWTLFACWALGAALSMGRVRAGFLTNYLADITFPPWYYIVVRGLASRDGRGLRALRWFGGSPARTALAIFGVGVASELAQGAWAGRVIAGTYDPWDIVAYALGLACTYVCDPLRQQSQPGP
jgi:hypothetical protein